MITLMHVNSFTHVLRLYYLLSVICIRLTDLVCSHLVCGKAFGGFAGAGR